MLDSRVPASVDATVEDGVITLTGRIPRSDQREEAGTVAGRVPGIVEVQNHVVVHRPTVGPDAAAVEGEIRTAFLRNAVRDADNVGVTTSEGTVTLTGTVHSWEELETAVAAARAAPGVHRVDNQPKVAF